MLNFFITITAILYYSPRMTPTVTLTL